MNIITESAYLNVGESLKLFIAEYFFPMKN